MWVVFLFISYRYFVSLKYTVTGSSPDSFSVVSEWCSAYLVISRSHIFQLDLLLGGCAFDCSPSKVFCIMSEQKVVYWYPVIGIPPLMGHLILVYWDFCKEHRVQSFKAIFLLIKNTYSGSLDTFSSIHIDTFRITGLPFREHFLFFCIMLQN